MLRELFCLVMANIVVPYPIDRHEVWGYTLNMSSIHMRILSLAALLLTPYYTFAASNAGFEGLNTLIRSFADGVVRSTGYMMFTLAVVAFFWGIVQFIWSARQGSDGKENTKGKQFMLWGLIALFVMFSVWGIIKFAQGVFKIQGDNTIIVPDLNFKSSTSQTGVAQPNITQPASGTVTMCPPSDIENGRCFDGSANCSPNGCTIVPAKNGTQVAPGSGGSGGAAPTSNPAASSGGGVGANNGAAATVSRGAGSSATAQPAVSGARTAAAAKPFTANDRLGGNLGLFGEEASLGISGSRTGASAAGRSSASAQQNTSPNGLVTIFNNTVNGVTGTIRNVWSRITGGTDTRSTLIQETDGWKYYSDGTAIGPDGTYYFQGKAVTGQGGQGAPTSNDTSCGEGFSYDAESGGCSSVCGSGFSYDSESSGCVSTDRGSPEESNSLLEDQSGLQTQDDPYGIGYLGGEGE